MFKRLLLCLCALVLCLSAAIQHADDAHAAPSSLDKKFGVGGMIGTEIAGNFVIRLGDRGELDLALGGGWNRGAHMYTHVQYLHKFPLGKWSAGELSLPVGVGLQFAVHPGGRNLIAGKQRCHRCKRRSNDYDGTYRYRYAWRHEKPWVGVRVPFGLNFGFAKAPVDIFAEFGPGIYLAAVPDFNFTFTTGARYWF